MAIERKPYRREAEDKRRLALIEATLALVSEGGAASATVRAIAARAGVTAGLIRHYFQTKEELVAASYRHLMISMTANTASVLTSAPRDANARLVAFVAAALRPPVLDREAVVRWAAFIQETRNSPVMQDIHRQTYLAFRDQLQGLIAALPNAPPGIDDQRRLAIACNAVLDGLWLEGSTLPDAFAKGEVVRIGVKAVGSIVGVDLNYYLLLSEPPDL